MANKTKRQVRIDRAIRRLKITLECFERLGGAKCVKCGNRDIRILTINHLTKKSEWDKKNPNNLRRFIALGLRKPTGMEVRCHNCNILYEYERGRRIDVRGRAQER